MVDDSPRESDLIDGCRRGDPAAQRQVFDRYRDRVFSIALNYLKGDEDGALDITQEVFVKVFRAIPSFREDARLSTWLYRVVVNACLDELRKRRRVLPFGDLPRSAHPSVPAAEPRELDPDIAAALGGLSPKLRIVVLLRHFEDMTYDEMATALGVSPGTVASRLSRAHALLARALGAARPESGNA